MVWGLVVQKTCYQKKPKKQKTICVVYFGSWFERVVSMMVGKPWYLGIEADVWDSSDLSGS